MKRAAGKPSIWKKLAKDPIRFVAEIGALYPDMMREMIRDQMAEAGITEENLRDLIQKLERPQK